MLINFSEKNGGEKQEEETMSKSCPICRSPMHTAGKLKPYNPHGRNRFITVYYCKRCRYRTLGG